MKVERWKRVCVVGVGHHARTKLIPAIRSNGQELAGVVSRRPGVDEGAPRFSGMAEAVEALPPDTVFFIASPPTVHFAQAMPALLAGRDVIVEKPAFVTAAEAGAAARAAKASGALLVEGFMNRHTATHRLFLQEWAAARPDAVEALFTIPSVPEATFRSNHEIGASNLYDIASYILSALMDAGAALDGIELTQVSHAGQPDQERLLLEGLADGVPVSIVAGIDETYANTMRLVRAGGQNVTFTPFVYGRPGPRLIRRGKADAPTETPLVDVNAFEAMLTVPLPEWRATAELRARRMIELTRQLERLGRRLTVIRAAVRDV